jgi:hypothetical protein
MTTVQTITDETRKRRVVVFRRDDGSFGFEEERFSDEPLESAWIPFGRYSVCRCDTAERALVEARSRVPWLAWAAFVCTFTFLAFSRFSISLLHAAFYSRAFLNRK